MRIYTMASFSGVICKIVRLKHNSADICSQLSGQLLDYSECLSNFALERLKHAPACSRRSLSFKCEAQARCHLSIGNGHHFTSDKPYWLRARCCTRCRSWISWKSKIKNSWRQGANAERCNLNFSLFTQDRFCLRSPFALPSFCPRYSSCCLATEQGERIKGINMVRSLKWWNKTRNSK